MVADVVFSEESNIVSAFGVKDGFFAGSIDAVPVVLGDLGDVVVLSVEGDEFGAADVAWSWLVGVFIVADIVSVEDGFDACLADTCVCGVEPEWFSAFEVFFAGCWIYVISVS